MILRYYKENVIFFTDSDDEVIPSTPLKRVYKQPKLKGKEPAKDEEERPNTILISRKRGREDEASTSTVVSIPKRQRPIAVARSRAAPNPILPAE